MPMESSLYSSSPGTAGLMPSMYGEIIVGRLPESCFTYRPIPAYSSVIPAKARLTSKFKYQPPKALRSP